MDHLPVNKNVKFAKLLSTNPRFANFSLLAVIAVASAGLVIVSGLAMSSFGGLFRMKPDFSLEKSAATSEPRSDALGEREAESLRRQESLLRGLPFQQALASIQAQLTSVSSPTKLGKSGILTITDSGILKPTDHNQTQGGIGTDVSRIGKIWGTFMDLNDDVSINGKLDLAGKLTANGNVTLGNNDGDEIEIGGRFTSNLVPKKTNDIDIGTTGLRFRTGYFVNSLVIGSGTTTITTSGITTTGGSSTTITSSLLNLVSTGTLQLDTSTNNNNILLLSGTGNVGIGSTAPSAKLDVVGDMALNGDLDFTGSQNITTTADNLTISPTGNLNIDTSGGTLSIRDAAIDLTNQSTTISGSTLTLRSTGTFILDTSASNTNIALQAGTGTLNISATTARLTGNLIVTGTGTFNGIAYTFPGTQTASGVLTTDGAGILSWGTIGAANITADSLDFAQFDDSLDLDADTSINGDYSLIVRSGLGSIQNSTSGSNDLQLSAEDKLILGSSSFDLLTSSGAVDIISGSYLDLSSKGTLTLDTSANNTNIVLTPGTGNIGIGSTAPVYKLDVNGTLRTTSTARIEGALTVTTGGASVTGDLSLDGDLDFTGAQNITTTSDNLTISPNGNLVIDTSGGTLSIRDAAIDLTNQPTTISGSSLTLRATGNFILDTSANNTNLVLQGGTGGLTGSFGTANLTAVTDSVSSLYLNAQRGGITLSSSNASGNGPIRILSGGSLQLSTSQGNQPIYLQAGTGNVNVSSNQLYLTGNLVVTGTETLNGIAYTFPGAQTANGVLLTDGSGVLSWSTGLTGASLADDTLDFVDLQDELDLDADTSINGDYSLIVRSGLGSIQNSTSGSNDLQLSAEDKLILGSSSFDLLTSSGAVDIISGSYLDLSSKGTLTLDTSANNTNIVLTPGTGNIGIGSTAPVYKLDVNGTLRTTGAASITGDLTLDGDLDFTGAQNITTTSDNLTISPNGNLVIDTSGGTLSIRDAAIDLTNQPTTISGSSLTLRATGNFILDTSANNTNLVLQGGTGGLTGSFGTANLTAVTDSVSSLYLNAQRGGITLSSSNASGNGPIRILSGGSLQLSTSQGNQPIYLQAGTGNLNVSSNQLYLTGNLVVTGTETFNGIAYTFPGADTANGVLLTDGSGVLSWTTGLTGASLADDTLDFVDLQDELDLDADTSVNGDYSLIIRSGLGSIQNSTSGSNDFQLSAEDKLIFDAASLTLTTSSGPIDILSRGYLDLSSTGTLTLDTSQNNTNILLKAGSGSINLSSGTTTISGNVNLNSGTLALNGVTYTFPGADGSASNALTTNGSGLLSWGTLGAASITNDSLDFAQFDDALDLDADTSINGPYSFIVRAGNAARQNATSGNNDLQLSAEDQILIHGSALLLETSSASAGQLVIRSDGTLQLDTSANNSNIQLQAGSGNINLSSTGTITLTGNTSLNNGTLRLNGLTYTFPGADTANGVLLTDGSGVLSWTTGLTGASLADDTLDFVDLQDELDFDADTSINGDYSLIVRAGLGSIQNSTSGSNDLQLAAEDKLIFDAASFTLTASSGPIDILSRGYLDLSSTGTLTLDTSQNNTNILLKAGSGSINLSSGTTTISGNVNLNSGTLTLNGVAYTFPGSDGSASQALTTNASGILSWSTIGVSADSLDFTDLKDTLTMDSDTAINGDYSFILRAGLGSIQNSTSGSNDIQLAAEDRMDLYAGSYSLTTSGNSVDILSGGRIDLSSKGTLTLDTSQNNSQILIRAGTGRVDVSGNTILVNAGTGTLTLSSSGGITIGGEGATTRVSGDLNFTGRLLEDGNEIFANQIAAFASACPTGWSEYTAARGRYIVGTPLSGTNAGTSGTALTDLESRAVGQHLHSVDPPSTSVSISDPGHSHTFTTYSGGDPNSGGPPYQQTSPISSRSTSSNTTGISASVDIAAFNSANAGSVAGTNAPYIQLTYCQKTAGADYAEWTRSREQYSPGTIVSADPQASEQIKITEKPYDSTMLGIISTTPGWTVGVQTADSLQLALNGRVPVKIDPDSPPIAVGDFLTSSAKPGLAMKATKMGYSVGKALENWQPNNQCSGSIENSDIENSLKIENCPAEQGPALQDKLKIDSIMVFVNLGTYLGPLTADGYIDTGANFIAGDVKVDLKKTVYQQLMSELNLPSNSPSNLPQNPLNSSNFPDPSDPSLPAEASAEEGVSASVSQVLSALAGKLEKAEGRISDLESQIEATDSAQPLSIVYGPSSISGSYLDSDLTVSGKTTLADTGIAGTLTVGLVTINDLDASINSMGETLKLQSLGMGNIEFMGGGAVIDTKGNLVLKSGDLSIETGRIAGNSSFRGSVIMPASPDASQGGPASPAGGPAGQGSLRIDTSWDTPPVTINVTPTWNTTVWVEDISATGFTARVSQPPAADSRLFWLAIW